MKNILALILLGSLFSSCNEESQEEAITPCEELSLNSNTSYNQLVKNIDEALLMMSVEKPNALGALGRNKEAYFHVRFQMSMTKLTDYAIANERVDALQEFVKTLDYAFSFQEENGGFTLSPPADLATSLPPANEGDRVSAVAFFAYSLGISLHSLNTSDWYLNAAETEPYRNQINAFSPKIEYILTYLENNADVLKLADQHAPNRLLFDGIAFYTLGSFLGDETAKSVGLDFTNLALELVDATDGYFIEGGGWDSSYNGVALKIGLELFSILPPSALKTELGKTLTCAATWQQSRIRPSGEVSTEGNTRVYAGGEAFLGNEKTVDVEKTVKAFLYFGTLTGENAYQELAMRVLEYYM